MAWTFRSVFGGETLDNQSERVDSVRASDVVVDSTAAGIETGARCDKFPTNTNAAIAILPAAPVAVGSVATQWAFSGTAKLSGTPSAAIGLISINTQGGARYCRIQTDGTVTYHDSAGTQLGQATNIAISTSALKRFLVAIDERNGGLSTAISLYVDGKWQHTYLFSNASTSIRPSTITDTCWGEYLPAATNRGADLYADNLVTQTVTSSDTAASGNNDPTTLTKYPVLVMKGGGALPPAANGSQTGWTFGAGAADYTEVDDAAGNDGDTSWVGHDTVDIKETYQYTAANPFTSSHTIYAVWQRYVARIVSGGKLGAAILYRDGSGNESGGTSFPAYSTSYAAFASPGGMARPAGGSWVYTDFDLSGGESVLEFGGKASPIPSVSFRWTYLPGPEVVYQDSGAATETGVLPWRTAAAIAA